MTSSSRASIRVGSYQLGERIGEGAFAHVHRAVGTDGRPVAIKLLAPEAELGDEAARARFAREVRTLAELNHPGTTCGPLENLRSLMMCSSELRMAELDLKISSRKTISASGRVFSVRRV